MSSLPARPPNWDESASATTPSAEACTKCRQRLLGVSWHCVECPAHSVRLCPQCVNRCVAQPFLPGVGGDQLIESACLDFVGGEEKLLKSKQHAPARRLARLI